MKKFSILEKIKNLFTKLHDQSTGVGRIFQRSKSFDMSNNSDHNNDVIRFEKYPYDKKIILPFLNKWNDNTAVLGSHTVSCGKKDHRINEKEKSLQAHLQKNEKNDKSTVLQIRNIVAEGRERRDERKIVGNDKKDLPDIVFSSKKSLDRSNSGKDQGRIDDIQSNLMPFQSNRYVRCKPYKAALHEKESTIPVIIENFDKYENANGNENANENDNENENCNENENENEILKGHEDKKADVWQEHYSLNGDIYYHSLLTGESTWDPPSKENSQIEYQYQDTNGCPYWYNSSTGESKWF